MENPWQQFPTEKPFLLSGDIAAIQEFNSHVGKDYRIQTHLLPGPFVGHPDAKVYLLNLNPGYDVGDDYWHQQDSFAKNIRQNLVHSLTTCPFYYLNDEFQESPGANWWRTILGPLMSEVGIECLRSQLMCLELFPYHSKQFKPIPERLSALGLRTAQRYSRYLVRQAITRNRSVVLMRSFSEWTTLVPELDSYVNCHRIRNRRRPFISPGNLDDYQALVKALSL